MKRFIMLWMLLWMNIPVEAGSVFSDTLTYRKQWEQAVETKDSLNSRLYLEKYAFYGTIPQKIWAYTQLGKQYSDIENYPLSLRYYDKATKLATVQENPKLFLDYQTMLVLSHEYAQADSYHNMLLSVAQPLPIQKESNFIYLISLLHQTRWEDAKTVCKVYFSDTTTYWDSVFARHTSKLRLKSVTLAKALSILLPGSGQLYAGYWFKGLMSFFLVALAGTFVVFCVLNHWYLVAYLTGFNLLRRVYVGGIKFAAKQVNYTNAKRTNKAINALKKEIEQKLP